MPGAAQAMCSAGAPPIVAELQRQIERSPAAALTSIERRLADPSLGRIDRAWLHAAEALAYSSLELNANEVAAADKGLALAPDPRDAPHVELLIQKAFGQSDPAEIKRLLDRINAARRHVEPNSIADICSRAAAGWLADMVGDPAEALRQLGQAYRMAVKQGLGEQRAGIAMNLAGLMMKGGDADQAEAINEDVIRWANANGQTFRLTAATYVKAKILMSRKDFAGALPLLSRTYRLARRIGNDQFAGFASLAACQAQIELGRFEDADRSCRRTARLFGTETLGRPRLLGFQARIAHGLGRHDEAVRLATEIVDAPVLRALGLAAAYRTRASARAALGDHEGAYRDLSEHLRLFTEEKEATLTRETATLRTRVEIDRQIERNAALRRELAFAEERARYNRNRWATIAIAVSGLVAMLLYILWNGGRHRRALEALASSDGLTGIANRRHATEQAQAALARAADARSPVVAALLDIDHFKAINDSEGHAAGDAALKELARILRDEVRKPDIVGRWGGEEFLIVLPGLDERDAADVVERVRGAAARLERPLRFSAGIAAAAPGERQLETIVARADEALYAAKRNGRNRSVVAPGSDAVPDQRCAAGQAENRSRLAA